MKFLKVMALPSSVRTVSMYSGSQTSQNQTSSDFILVGLFGETKHALLLYTATFIFFLMALAGNALLSIQTPGIHRPSGSSAGDNGEVCK